MHSSIREVEPLRRKLAVVMWIVAIVSGLLTYYGLAALLPKPKALLLAIISVILSTTSWGFLITQWGKGSKEDRHQLKVLFAIPVAALVTVTSTALAFYALALPEAQRRDLVHLVDEASVLVQALRRERSQERRLIPVLEQAGRSYRAAAEQERSTGRYSGRRGRRGSVFAGLEALAASFEDAALVMKEAEQDGDENLHEAEALLLAMRTLAVSAEADTEGLRAARLEFEKKLLRLNSALGRASQSPVENVLSVIEGGLAQQKQSPLTAKRAKNRQKEADGQAAVARMARETERRLQKVVGQLDRNEIELPMLRLALPFEAISEHFSYVFPFLAYAIVIDALPLLSLLMLGFVMERLPKGELAASRQTPAADPTRARRPAAAGERAAPHSLQDSPEPPETTHAATPQSALERLIAQRRHAEDRPETERRAA